MEKLFIFLLKFPHRYLKGNLKIKSFLRKGKSQVILKLRYLELYFLLMLILQCNEALKSCNYKI